MCYKGEKKRSDEWGLRVLQLSCYTKKQQEVIRHENCNTKSKVSSSSLQKISKPLMTSDQAYNQNQA